MDEATKRQRARNKVMAGKRGELGEFEARGYGRARKTANTFPIRQCDFLTGATKITFRRQRKDGTDYMVSIWKGGKRCLSSETQGGRCLAHLGKPIVEGE